MTQSRLVIIEGLVGGVEVTGRVGHEGKITKGHKETFSNDGYVHYLD